MISTPKVALALGLLLSFVHPMGAEAQFAGWNFTNPIVHHGADPWMQCVNGWYYYTDTKGKYLAIRRSRTLAGLDRAEPKIIWRAPDHGPNCRSIWAPEFHHIGSSWYLYYTATTEDGADANLRIFVLKSKTDDLLGEWQDLGKLRVPSADDAYAIDGTLYQAFGGKLYFVWSGREKSEQGPQNIYIAPMSDPITISGPRVRLSTPDHPWEKHGWEVNEGPEVLVHRGAVFIVYSGSGYATEHYCLGLLTHRSGDVLDPTTWQKSPEPVFSELTTGDKPVYGPGHCGFFTSPNGAQDWIVYHARVGKDIKETPRDSYAQPFHWTPDGKPDFGKPIPAGVPIPSPAGESNG